MHGWSGFENRDAIRKSVHFRNFSDTWGIPIAIALVAEKMEHHRKVSTMLGIQDTGSALDTVAHVIQVALTPIFLLSGIATLLNVFSTRLARVADRVESVAQAIGDANATQAEMLAAQLARLHRRSVALDVAVVLAAVAGAATCVAVLALFLAKLIDAESSAVMLFAVFGLAVICALGAIVAFTIEMLMAGTGIRAEVALSQRTASE